jgi:PAS domain S-box-containing protein
VEIAFASAMAILLLAAGLSHRSGVAAIESDHLIRHTHEVIETLQDLTLRVRTIESSARSFALTGDDSYLRDYRSSKQRMAQDEQAFGALTVDNPEQQQRLPDLERLATAKVQLAEAIVDGRRDQGLDAAVEVVQKGEGQRLMTEFLAEVDAAKREEWRMLTIRDLDSQRTHREAAFSLIFATVLGLAITAAAGWTVQRDNRRREQAEEALFAEKERAHVTLNSIGDAVASTDIAGNLTFLNPIAEEMSGWRSQEAVGRSLTEVLRILNGASHETIPISIERTIVENQSGRLPPNSILIRRDELEIPVAGSVAPMHDQD